MKLSPSSQSGRVETTVIWILFIALAVVAASFFRFEGSTNCGGNSAALADVQQYAMLARVYTMEDPDHTFCVTSITMEQRKQIALIGRSPWLPGVRFLVSTNAIHDTQSNHSRRIIIVSDTAFNNVPRRWLLHAPFTYAVGFSDGTTGLISGEEFAKLNRASFKYLDALYQDK